MEKKLLKNFKTIRILSQAFFLGFFVFIFIRSLDPFSNIFNPFLRYDPLIYFTHLQPELTTIVPIIVILLLTLLLGRFFCGWVCPLGSSIDILDLILKPIRKTNPLSKGSDFFKKHFIHIPPSLFILGAVSVTLFFTPSIMQLFHPNVWIVRIYSLSTLGISFAGFLLICSLIMRRLWCKYICPLGALYGLLAKLSIFKLSITKCSGCGRCNTCPMDAADFKEKSILRHQCILCFDYEHRCPVAGFSYGRIPRPEGEVDYSRRSFLKTGGIFFGGLLFGGVFSIFDKTVKTQLLRPPGVIRESEFVQRCLRCFQCVESCPNQIIKITRFEAGFDSLFTPHLEFKEYGCDYNCQVCQLVCPNYAIPRQLLSEKQKSKIGLASIDQNLCVVFAQDTNCLVCEEFCPIPEKAIKIDKSSKLINGKSTLLKYPVVDKNLCIGCGICEAFCPVHEKAIRVFKT